MQTDENFVYRRVGSLLEAERCLQCHDAPCSLGCPAGVDVKRFIGLIQKGEYEAAAWVIEQDNPLGLICGYTCPTIETCQKECVSAKLGRPIDIRALQSYTIEHSREMGNNARQGHEDIGKGRRFNKAGVIETRSMVGGGQGKVAVIGSGPAGLSAAWYLKQLGYEIELFESSGKLGGRMTQGIPPFRVDPDMVKNEIDEITQNMEVHFGMRLGRDFTVNEMLQNEFRGIVLAIGRYQEKISPIGEGCTGSVYGADEILNDKKWKEKNYKEAVVVGAGNVAIDAARTLIRGGVEKVNIIYRGGNQQVKALQEEREEAFQDGIALHLFAVPKDIKSKDGVMIGVVCRRSSVEQGENGCRSLSLLDDTYDFTIPADMLVMAIGYDVRAEDVITSGRVLENGIENIQNYSANVPGVYAVGDMIGGKSIVEAVRDGKGAAFALHEYLVKEESK